MEKCYLQLYSLGASLQQDFIGSLEKLSKIGFTGVEFAGGFYGGMSAVDLKAKLKALNLEPLSSHLMAHEIEGQLDYAVELGLKYIIIPMSFISTEEEALDLAKELNRIGKIAKERGIRVGYHNHRHEFLEGANGYLLETIINNTNPEFVCFQLDVGWATCSGIDCPEFIKKHSGRIALIHVKECNTVAGAEKMPDLSSFEMDANGMPIIPPETMAKFAEQTQWNVPNGTGIVDWQAVCDAAKAQGAEGFIVEREFNYSASGDIFECVKADCEHLKNIK